MKSLIVTGSSGFVGKNLENYFKQYPLEFEFIPLKRNELINPKIQCNKHTKAAIIHLAGKAHDLKKVSNPGEYYKINTKLTEDIFDAFLESEAEVFIMLSSVKASADSIFGTLYEDAECNPTTDYGKSKLLAEKYIMSKQIPENKRVYILRPCMIHGPGNKGNLNLLFQIVKKGFPWPLGIYENRRSLCSIENLCFVIKELFENKKVPSGIYQVADSDTISTNEIIGIIAIANNRKPKIAKISKRVIKSLAIVGDYLYLPLTTELLQKLTESYIVSNDKICNALQKNMPVNIKDGLIKTIQSFI